MTCRDLDLLWKEYCTNPSQFWDCQTSKTGPRSTDFRHRQTREPLYMEGLHNANWVKEELRRSTGKNEEVFPWKAGGEDEVLKIHQEFQDRAALFDLVKACGKQKDLCKGSRIHADLLKTGLLGDDISLGNALLSMYTKCGTMAKAQELFDQLPARNVVTWNALITGYAQHGLGDEALRCFGRMQDEGLCPNAVTFICILKACSCIGAVEKGEEVHAEASRQGLLERDIVLGTALVDMYAKCGVLAKARRVFDKLPARNAVTWNALIGGYAQHGLGNEALRCFGRMRYEGFSPDAVTFICILQACGSIGAAEKGEEIHAELSKQGLLEKNMVLGNALLDMYAKCGVLAKAQAVFDELPTRDVATWTALIAGYAQHGFGEEALCCFRRMQNEGLSPNTITFICILKACSSIGAAKEGEEVHAEISRQGLLEKHIVLGNALVDMYAKCGMPSKAQEVFDELRGRDIATWTALIDGYAQHGLGEEALRCFGRMQDEGFYPDIVTFVCMLKACGTIGAAEKGEEIRVEVDRQGFLEKDIVVGNALVDMYAKCGALAEAQEVFERLPARNVSTWTALIAGYAQVGSVKAVSDLFIKMTGEGIEPNMVTFVVLLTACSHAGLVEEGQMYFHIMSTVYCIIPTSEHRTCMVDLFSRAGHFDKALGVIEKVPASEILLLLSALMGKWVSMELGRWAFEHALRLDENFAIAYICMSNICAAAGMQQEVDGTWKTLEHSHQK